MPSVEKRLLDSTRVRSVPKSGFSWIDRRLVRDGFLDGLTGSELLLYVFLCIVADKDGLSFFGDRRLARTLKLGEATLEHARRSLERKELILHRSPLYQVLALPDLPTPIGVERFIVRATSTTNPRVVGEMLGDIL